jgi:regulator of sigma E protease
MGSSKAYSFVVERKDRHGAVVKRTLQVLPEPPRQSPTMMGINPTSIESVGVAFEVLSEVATVDASGPAAAAGIASGDRITKFEFVGSGDKKVLAKLESLLGVKLFGEFELAEGKSSWPDVFVRLQLVPRDTKIKLTYLRGKETKAASLTARESVEFFDETRGLETYDLTHTHTAKDWGEAAQLGFRETYERVKEVIVILHSLVTGWLSPTNLSGPPGILMAAAGFASEGFASLLMFLVILSANLAVLNFLPIPALDGGHMLFLTAEGIRGKPVDERLQIRLTIAGVICLLTLMVFATAMDIGRFAELIRSWF